MAAKKVPMLYPETMEEAQKESKESHSIGHSGMAGVGSKQLLEGLAQAGYYSILDRYESLHLCD